MQGNEMEARRAYQGGATSSKQIYIVVSALLVALALALAAVYLSRGVTSASPTSRHSVQASFQAPDAQERNAQINASRNPQPTHRATHGAI
jgi:hypothetical protein